MLKRFIIPLLLLAGSFGLLQLFASFKKEQKRMPPRPVVRTVIAKKVHYGPVIPVIETMGRIAALERVALTPEVSGIVMKEHFRLYKGTSFRKNDILFTIDSSQVFFGYSATVSDLQNAVAGLIPEFTGTLPDAQKQWEQFFSLLSVKHLPELPATTSEREKLLATRYNVYKLYYLAQQQLNTLQKHTLAAPFDGTVESTQIYPASMARAASAVASLVRTDVLEIEIALAVSQLSAITTGTAVTVTLPERSDTTFSGTLDRIGTVVDDRMQTASVFVLLKNLLKTHFRPGAYAQVRIGRSAIAHGFSLPRKALYNNNLVYTIDHDTLAQQAVAVAYLSTDSAYCTGGLSDGATLIVEPLQDAVTGMAVQSEATARARMKQGAMPEGASSRKGPASAKVKGAP